MAKRKSKDISRRNFLGVSIGTAVVAGIGCGTNDKGSQQAAAGQTASGGTGPNGSTSTSAGGTTAANGGASTGGTTAANGGASTGGTTAANGGASTGGTTAANGGASTGGTTAATGGASSTTGGSTAKGGTTATGGSKSTGGTATSGGTSGTGPAGAKLVGLVRNTDLVKATKDAIAAAGGLPNLAGKTVLLKPNLLSGTASPCTPNPEVVRGVIQAVKAAGATKILIGDSPAGGTAVNVMASVGIHTVTQDEGVTEVNFTTATLVPQPTGAAKWTSGINIYKDLLDDGTGKKPYIINICCCKHHGSAVWSLAMKNWYGIVPSGDRKHVNNGMATQPQIAEIHLAVKEDFVILDATKAYITQGPSSGTVASPGIVVATADAVAAEATGLAILRQYRSAGGVAKDDIENVKIFSTDAKTLMGRALSLGNGWITSRAQYTYSATGLGADEATIIAQLDL